MLASLAPPVEVRLIKHLTTDLRPPTQSSDWQQALEIHRRRRRRECRKVKPSRSRQPSLAQGPVTVSRSASRSRGFVASSGSVPTGLERYLTAPGIMLRQAD